MKKLAIILITLSLPFRVIAETESKPAPLAPLPEQVKAQLATSFADIVEPLIPAVVNIYTVKYNKHSHPQKTPFPEGFPFDHFSDFFEQFNLPFNFDEMYSNPKAISLGSGFIIESSGFVVTNCHVVSNADEIYVKLIDNTELPAKLMGSDKRSDLALLKIESPKPLPFVKFGDSSKARIGDWVIAIGNPFGLGGTVTTGIISSKGRDIDINSMGIVDDFIQTDAAINSGNSGGPMFNIHGEVIGVNTAIFSPSGTSIGIGFSIPSNTAKVIVEQLEKTGKISRGRLDVTIQEITPEIAEGLALKEPVGALVVEVMPSGAGDKAGIKSGDVIIEFSGQVVKNPRKLQILVAETPVDKEVKIVVVRNGKNTELSGKITETIDKDNSPAKAFTEKDQNKLSNESIRKNNITFTNLTDEIRRKYGIEQDILGLVITDIAKNKEDKELKTPHLKVGDIVTAINQQPVTNIEKLDKIYQEAKATKKQNIVLLVKRRNASIFIALPVV